MLCVSVIPNVRWLTRAVAHHRRNFNMWCCVEQAQHYPVVDIPHTRNISFSLPVCAYLDAAWHYLYWENRKETTITFTLDRLLSVNFALPASSTGERQRWAAEIYMELECCSVPNSVTVKSENSTHKTRLSSELLCRIAVSRETSFAIFCCLYMRDSRSDCSDTVVCCAVCAGRLRSFGIIQLSSRMGFKWTNESEDDELNNKKKKRQREFKLLYLDIGESLFRFHVMHQRR